MNQSGALPEWAQRVKQSLISRLYKSDAQGLRDEDLLNEVGWGLYARCQSFIEANEAVQGRAKCPACGVMILHQCQPEETLHCPSCGWENTWKLYFQTIQHRQLSGAAPVIADFQTYADRFPAARKAEEKMLLIDLLLHTFHWNMRLQMDTRAAGVNLIEGNYHQVVEFLDSLSYGPGSTPGVQQQWEAWQEKLNRTADLWRDERLRRQPRKES